LPARLKGEEKEVSEGEVALILDAAGGEDSGDVPVTDIQDVVVMAVVADVVAAEEEVIELALETMHDHGGYWVTSTNYTLSILNEYRTGDGGKA